VMHPAVVSRHRYAGSQQTNCENARCDVSPQRQTIPHVSGFPSSDHG